MLLLLAASALAAQEPISVPLVNTPPVLDGVVNEAEWRLAGRLGALRQVEPVEGAEPSERTEVFLCHDGTALYIGLRCLDSVATEIHASLRRRDADLDADDRVEVLLDTFLDRRNGYFFQIGAGGSRGDALIGSNGMQFAKSWDTLWEGEVSRDADGWYAELRIPASSLGMSEIHESFGFNVRRILKRKNEEMRWASPERRLRFFTPSSAGLLKDVSSLQAGSGIDAVPYVKARARMDHLTGKNDFEMDAGLDLRWRITPALTTTFTTNTDFAETEVDSRVINLDRFSVYFPEKRDFFLEDTNIFAFGGLGGFRSSGGEPLPLFTRTIGISAAGEPVPILAGARVSGRVGEWNMGALAVSLDELTNTPATNLGVVRVSRNILDESSVGVLATMGDPLSRGREATLGADFTWRTMHFMGDHVLRADAFVLGTMQESTNAADDSGWAVGGRIMHPGDEFFAEAAWQEVSEAFDPALGFVPRNGVRHLKSRFGWTPRFNSAVRELEFGIDPDVWLWRDNGDVQSATIGIQFFGIELASEDELKLFVVPERQGLREPFEITNGVVIPAGDHEFTRWGGEIMTSNARPIGLFAEVLCGEFFGGTASSIGGGVEWRPTPGFMLSLGAQQDSVSLPQGDFDVELAKLRAQWDISTDLSLAVFAQYDTESQNLGINARLHWALKDGDDVHLVVNQGLQERDILRPGAAGFEAVSTDIALKCGLTFRF
jgi:hypothetical protein